MPHWEAPVNNREDFTLHAWDESYTLPENQFLAYQRTGNARYLELAKRLLFNQEFFDPLANGENVLPGKHAYSHVNSLSSAAQAYLVLGDPQVPSDYKERLRLCAPAELCHRRLGTGRAFRGSGQREIRRKPGDHALHFRNTLRRVCPLQTHALSAANHPDSAATATAWSACCTTPCWAPRPFSRTDPASTIPITISRARKLFFGDKWPCCSGTLPQIAADYRISAYFRDDRGVYVNLYAPSTLSWTTPGTHLALRQITEYPYDSFVRLDVTASRAETFSVFLRIPEWAEGASLTLNGLRDSRKLQPGTFAEIRREWKTADRIELELPLKMRLEAVDAQHPNTVALVAGPLVLMPLRGASLPPARPALLAAHPESPGSRTWMAGDLKLRSFPDINHEPYSAYLRVTA